MLVIINNLETYKKLSISKLVRFSLDTADPAPGS